MNFWEDCARFSFGRGMNYSKFIYQCKGDVIDFVEEALLDSVLIAGRRGYYILKDHYLNSNNSTYYVYFANYKDAAAVAELLQAWDDFAAGAAAYDEGAAV